VGVPILGSTATLGGHPGGRIRMADAYFEASERPHIGSQRLSQSRKILRVSGPVKPK